MSSDPPNPLRLGIASMARTNARVRFRVRVSPDGQRAAVGWDP